MNIYTRNGHEGKHENIPQGNLWRRATLCCSNYNVKTNRPDYKDLQEQEVPEEAAGNTYTCLRSKQQKAQYDFLTAVIQYNTQKMEGGQLLPS